MSWIEGSVRWKRSGATATGPVLLESIGQAGLTVSTDRVRFTPWSDRHGRRPIDTCKDGNTLAIGRFRSRLAGASARRALAEWKMHGPTGFSNLDGDFAVAIWDEEKDVLVLARGPMSELPLAFAQAPDSTRFCSLAAALANGAPNLDWLADQQAGGPVFGTQTTFFKGVELVEPGTAVMCRGGEARVHRFFHAEMAPEGDVSSRAERLRHALDDAVGDVLSEARGRAVSQLSAGRDSGAVAATAARILHAKGQKLLALTAVPSATTAKTPFEAAGNEGTGAAAVAAMHKTAIEHHLVTVRNADLGHLLDRRNAFLPGPFGTPANLPWWDRIQKLASEAGADVLLTGSAGNLTISAGGPWSLGDLLAGGDVGGWLRAFIAARRFPGSSWANLVKHSVAPFAPASVAGRMQQVQGRHRRGHFFREPVASMITEAASRPKPVRRWSAARLRAIELNDGADPTAEILYGLTERDPTADRRVIAASLAFSPRDLASPYDQRPIYARAFADRLPASTIRPEVRHYQGTDWITAIDAAALRDSMACYARNPAVQDLLDVSAMRLALQEWPVDRKVDAATSDLFSDQLLPAIAVASFINCHWPA